jgi:hypothetical protein
MWSILISLGWLWLAHDNKSSATLGTIPHRSIRFTHRELFTLTPHLEVLGWHSQLPLSKLIYNYEIAENSPRQYFKDYLLQNGSWKFSCGQKSNTWPKFSNLSDGWTWLFPKLCPSLLGADFNTKLLATPDDFWTNQISTTLFQRNISISLFHSCLCQ